MHHYWVKGEWEGDGLGCGDAATSCSSSTTFRMRRFRLNSSFVVFGLKFVSKLHIIFNGDNCHEYYRD